MASDLRPLTTLEILDAAWLAVRRNWLNLYACSGVGTAPLALAAILYFVWLSRLIKGTEPSVFYTGTTIWAAAMAVGWALNGVARAAAVALVLGDARSQPITLGEAWKRAGKHAASAAFIALFCFACAWVGGVA